MINTTILVEHSRRLSTTKLQSSKSLCFFSLSKLKAEIMCQGDSIYDLVDYRDHALIHAELMSGPASISDQNFFSSERIFICRMNLSRTTKRQLQYHKVSYI